MHRTCEIKKKKTQIVKEIIKSQQSQVPPTIKNIWPDSQKNNKAFISDFFETQTIHIQLKQIDLHYSDLFFKAIKIE